MAERIVDVKLKTASDTQANWESKNTTLLDGELAYDKTKKNLKIGDGITAWNNLPYLIPEVEESGFKELYSAINFSDYLYAPIIPITTNGAYFSDENGNPITESFQIGETLYITNESVKTGQIIQISALSALDEMFFEKFDDGTAHIFNQSKTYEIYFNLIGTISNYYTKSEVDELIVETPIIEVENFSQLVADKTQNAIGTITEQQSSNIEKAKSLIVLDTTTSTSYYFTIQELLEGVLVFICDNTTSNVEESKIIFMLQGTQWVAMELRNPRFTQDIYNELKIDLTNYYTKDETYSKIEVGELIDEAKSWVDGHFYNKEQTYTKEEIENLVESSSSEADWQPINFYYANLSWEEFDVYDLEITNENYQQFLQNKKAPIEINGVLFDVYSFYDEDDGYYSVYYSSVVNNRIKKINILWQPDGSSVDDCENIVIDENYGKGIVIPEYVLDGFSVGYVEDGMTQADVDNIITNKMLNVIDSENGVSSLFTLVAQYEDRLLLNSNYTIEEDYLVTTSYLIAIVKHINSYGVYCTKYVHNLEASGSSSGEGLRIVDFSISIDEYSNYLTGELSNGRELMEADIIRINDYLLLHKVNYLEGEEARFTQINGATDASDVEYFVLAVGEDWYEYSYKYQDVSYSTPKPTYTEEDTELYGINHNSNNDDIIMFAQDRSLYKIDLNNVHFDIGSNNLIVEISATNTKILLYYSDGASLDSIKFNFRSGMLIQKNLQDVEISEMTNELYNVDSYIKLIKEAYPLDTLIYYIEVDEMGMCKLNVLPKSEAMS